MKWYALIFAAFTFVSACPCTIHEQLICHWANCANCHCSPCSIPCTMPLCIDCSFEKDIENSVDKVDKEIIHI